MSEETYEGIPRNKIVWHPIINYEKCTTCGKCVDFCHAQSFGFEEKEGKKKTVVKNLNACVVYVQGLRGYLSSWRNNASIRKGNPKEN